MQSFRFIQRLFICKAEGDEGLVDTNRREL